MPFFSESTYLGDCVIQHLSGLQSLNYPKSVRLYIQSKLSQPCFNLKRFGKIQLSEKSKDRDRYLFQSGIFDVET